MHNPPSGLYPRLVNKSAVIQMHIDDEAAKKNPDWFRIITLKKQRLMIKDKINKLRRSKNVMLMG
jgi:hypothetical protein